MSKKKNGKKSSKKSAPDKKKLAPVEYIIGLEDPKFCTAIAQQLLPEEDDKWVVGEWAAIVYGILGNLRKHVDGINRIATKAGGVKITISASTNRAQTPPLVKVGGSYNESHPMKSELDAFDIEQLDLFQADLENGEGEKTESTREPEPEPEPEPEGV